MSKRNIKYVQQEEPSFIQKFKARVGYKEGPTVDTKRAKLPEPGDSDQSDAEDEKPQVVVLKPGDLTAEEAEKLGYADTEGDQPSPLSRYEGPAPKNAEQQNEGRVIFKKPEKKTEDEDSSAPSKSKKGSKSDKKDIKSKAKKINNKKLLSFDEDEEEED